MVFVLFLNMVLVFVHIEHGDLQTALIVSAGAFVLSFAIAGVLIFLFKRG
jgi:Na+-driven multidrug efflux pump